MKRLLCNKNLYIVFIAAFYSLIVEKFMFPNTAFEIKRAVIGFLSFFLFVFFIFFIMKKDNIKIIVKTLFPIIISIFATIHYTNTYYFSFTVMEVICIFYFSNLIIKKKKKLGLIVNDILFLLLNIQLVILVFGGSFLELIMLTNLSSLEDLSGKTLLYGLGVIAVLLFSFIPIKKVTISKENNIIFYLSIVSEILFIILLKLPFSPLGNYCLLAKDEFAYLKKSYLLDTAVGSRKAFYKETISDYYNNSDDIFKNKPNIILIFTEGLSQNVVLDEKNIMPNVKKYENKSINFTGYYNHTFATYRGIIGQLYSGYQYDNNDSNHLISIQEILKSKGYETTFVNTEPKNKEFTKYIENMNFDQIVTSNKTKGEVNSVSDKDAYSLLYSTANKLSEDDKPFFISIYTFGTHVSLDSTDLKYGNGKDNLLNRFYNVDYYFGKFMDKFTEGNLHDNTMIIFTGDHCTYADMDFKRAFKYYPRIHTMVDPMPLFIYHKDIVHKDIEVNGRNSLDLAPTVLDYTEISAPNYFLGDSLFSGAKGGNDFDRIYHDDVNWVSTFDKQLDLHIEISQKKSIEKIDEYLSISKIKRKKND